MLTRFEVSGFKNLENVSVDFGPFTCIAGPNSVGKSNLFDAIEFLSLLSDHNFLEACTLIRPTPQQRSDVSSLFSTRVIQGHENLRLAAEMILPSPVLDEFSQQVEPERTFVRYEVRLAVRRGDPLLNGPAIEAGQRTAFTNSLSERSSPLSGFRSLREQVRTRSPQVLPAIHHRGERQHNHPDPEWKQGPTQEDRSEQRTTNSAVRDRVGREPDYPCRAGGDALLAIRRPGTERDARPR